MAIQDPVLVCTVCGEVNEFSDSECLQCKSSLVGVIPVDRASLNNPIQLAGTASLKLCNLALTPDRSPTGDELVVCLTDGEYVVGRSFSTEKPDIDLKDWTIPFVEKNERKRGISRQSVTLTRRGDEFWISRHKNASPELPVILNGKAVSGSVLLKDGDKLEIGDVFPPGMKPKAPGLALLVTITQN